MTVNKELVDLYWDIGRMIVDRQDAEGWGKAVVEYALHDTRKPIGVSTYEITKTLPKILKGQLSTSKEIAKLLEDL